jgi:hypothetical protein
VYVCDGAGTYAWLSGTAEDGTVTATSASEESAATGFELAAQIAGDQVTGTVTFPDATQHAFTATKATGKAGLYQRVWSADEEEPERVATIVLPDGAQKGGKAKVKKSFCKQLEKDYDLYYVNFQDAPPEREGFWLDLLGEAMDTYAESGCVDVTGSISSPTT